MNTSDPFEALVNTIEYFDAPIKSFDFITACFYNQGVRAELPNIIVSPRRRPTVFALIMVFSELFAKAFLKQIGQSELEIASDRTTATEYMNLLNHDEPIGTYDFIMDVMYIALWRLPYGFVEQQFLESIYPRHPLSNPSTSSAEIIQYAEDRRTDRPFVIAVNLNTLATDVVHTTHISSDCFIPRFSVVGKLDNSRTFYSHAPGHTPTPSATDTVLYSLVTHTSIAERADLTRGNAISDTAVRLIDQSGTDFKKTFNSDASSDMHAFAHVVRTLIMSLEKIVLYSALASAELYHRDPTPIDSFKRTYLSTWITAIIDHVSNTDTDAALLTPTNDTSMIISAITPISEWGQRALCHMAVISLLYEEMAIRTTGFVPVKFYDSLVYALAAADIQSARLSLIIDACHECWVTKDANVLIGSMFDTIDDNTHQNMALFDRVIPFTPNVGWSAFSEVVVFLNSESDNIRLATFMHLLMERNDRAPRDILVDSARILHDPYFEQHVGRRILRTQSPPNMQSLFRYTYDIAIDGTPRRTPIVATDEEILMIESMLRNEPCLKMIERYLSPHTVETTYNSILNEHSRREFIRSLNRSTVEWNTKLACLRIDHPGTYTLSAAIDSSVYERLGESAIKFALFVNQDTDVPSEIVHFDTHATRLTQIKDGVYNIPIIDVVLSTLPTRVQSPGRKHSHLKVVITMGTETTEMPFQFIHPGSTALTFTYV